MRETRLWWWFKCVARVVLAKSAVPDLRLRLSFRSWSWWIPRGSSHVSSSCVYMVLCVCIYDINATQHWYFGICLFRCASLRSRRVFWKAGSRCCSVNAEILIRHTKHPRKYPTEWSNSLGQRFYKVYYTIRTHWTRESSGFVYSSFVLGVWGTYPLKVLKDILHGKTTHHVCCGTVERPQQKKDKKAKIGACNKQRIVDSLGNNEVNR